MKKLLVCLGAVCALSFAAKAESPAPVETTPFMIGLFNPVQTPAADYGVHGLAIGGIWNTCSELEGVQVSLGLSFLDGDGIGVQGSLVGGTICEGDFSGVQWTYFGANVCHGTFHGFQDGLTAYANVGSGFQLSLVNMSHDFSGLQLGLINTAERLNGIQIGLINCIKESPLPFFPIANAHF